MSEIDVLTRIAVEWGERCFGRTHMLDVRLRALRMVEETIELAQSVDVDKDQLHRLIDVVYSRPSGDPAQELGGVMVTAAVLLNALSARSRDWDSPELSVDQSISAISFSLTGLEDAFEREVRRCLAKPPEHFTDRNQQKIDLGLR